MYKDKKYIFFLLSVIQAVIIMSGAVGPAYADCPQGMISYWKFEEESGDIYYDHSGSNNAECAGTCPSHTSDGVIANGQVFDGSQTGLSVPADPLFDWGMNDSFSIEFWMKRSSAGLTENEMIIGRRDDSTNMLWQLGIASDGRASFFLRATNGDGNSNALHSTTSLADGLWHHIVVIRNADTKQNVLYADGVLNAYVSEDYTAGFDSATAMLNIGWLNLDQGYHFGGTLDEVALYSKVLSAVEISQHYHDGLVGLRLGYCEGGFALNIMPLGDSITQGYIEGVSPTLTTGYRQKLNLELLDLNYPVDFVGSILSGQNASPDFDADHEGHPGWTDDEIVNGNPVYPDAGSLNIWLNDHNPNVILLHIGTNELSTSPNDVESILDAIDAYNEDIVVVLARIINRSTYSHDTTIFNDDVEDMAYTRIANGDRIILVDQESALTYPDDMSDAWHPTTDGYEKMASIWLEGLTKLLPLSPLDSEPVIFSLPKTSTQRKAPYTYDVNAAGNPVPTYELSSGPSGMIIDEVTGLIEWTPSDIGSAYVEVLAVNSQGSYLQAFTIHVLEFDQIIDNNSPYFIMNGAWYESTLVPGYYGDNYRWAYGGSGDVTAEWIFQLPSDGYYQVFAWWSAPFSSRPEDAHYTINHDGATSVVVRDQTTNGSQWNELGVFYFNAGEARVLISDEAQGNPVADAVRIRYLQTTAGFTGAPTTGTAPLMVAFNDTSTGVIDAWSWDFGDTGTSTEQHPSHEYAESGTYTVSLTVAGPNGTDTSTMVDYIAASPPAPPTAAFNGTGTAGTAPLAVPFTDTSTGVIDTWSWDFGDTGTSNEQNPSHVYMEPGTYTVSLTVTGAGGTDTSTMVEYINVSPPAPLTAGFTGTPTAGTSPLTVAFTDTSTGGIDTWNWNFGDTGTSTEQHPSHVYTDAGTYTVSLTVTGPNGTDTSTIVDCITVSEPAIDFDQVIDNNSPDFIMNGTWYESTLVPGFYGNNYSWAFGGRGDVTAEWLFQLPFNGYYKVSAWWSTPYATRPSDAKYTINHDGGPTLVTKNQRIDGSRWNELGTFYFSAGETRILISDNANGNPVADAVRIESVPITAGFTGTPTSGTVPLTVAFTDTSTGGIDTWNWNFGDTVTSTEQYPTHVYTEAGTYTVSLTVTGPNGTDTSTMVNYITASPPAPPAAGFTGTPTTGTVPLTVDFTDTSTGEIDTWSWDFGDTGTSTEQHPSHVYTDPGIYTVNLTVNGPNGTDTFSMMEYITVSDYDQIIDNNSSAFVMNGTWYESTLVPGYYGNNYRWAFGGSGDVEAEWVFQLPSNGSYRVLAWWSAPYATRPRDAKYTINHDGGQTLVTRDQRINGSRWNELGVFQFSAGETRVSLSDDAEGNPVADAVRIIRIND